VELVAVVGEAVAGLILQLTALQTQVEAEAVAVI
jgi:hypothetical protein